MFSKVYIILENISKSMSFLMYKEKGVFEISTCINNFGKTSLHPLLSVEIHNIKY